MRMCYNALTVSMYQSLIGNRTPQANIRPKEVFLMENILTQYADKINGSFSFFDRMIITGHLRSFFNSMMYFLSEENVLLKDYGAYVQGVTDSIKTHVIEYTNGQQRPLIYLRSPKTSKEQTAMECLGSNPVDEGLICTLSTVELCNAFSVISNHETNKLEIKCMKRKCLHYYFYYLDKIYGFMFVKLQTWFPFTITVYINGRELMRHALEENNISYQMYDNSFSYLSDFDRAQELADHFDSKKLSNHLDLFASRINPFLPRVKEIFGNGYYWCASQIEYATDIVFKDRKTLEDLYPSMVDHSFHGMNCTDVFSFMGKKLTSNFHGEAVADYKKRPIGYRVKFKLEANSIKMYDKGNSLRIETTINNPSAFKVYGDVHHRDGTITKQWKPMGKSISNLYRYAEIAKSSNKRYIDALENIIPVKSTLEEIEAVCSHKTVKGKTYTGFNVWEADTLNMLKVIADGKYLLSGITNKKLRSELYPESCGEKKTIGRTTRLLKKLRVHNLLRRIPHSQKYFVTNKGRRIINALIEMKDEYYPKAMADQKLSSNTETQAA